MHDIADVDLALFMLVCDHAGARGHDQHLVAVMRMPSRGATLAEIHHAAVIIRRVPGVKMVCRDRETGPVYPSMRSAPSIGAFGMSLSVTTFMTTSFSC
jgi:hypothetical protein